MDRSRKRKPEVVVFQEQAKKHKKKNSKQERRPNTSHDAGNINFKEIAREVRELGVSGFQKKDQRKFKQQEAQALGAKAPKKQKMPYPLLMKLKKIHNKKEKDQRQLDAAMGIFKRRKKSDEKDKPFLKGSGRWVDKSKGLDGGKYKKGVQKLKPRDIVKLKNSKT